MKSFQYGAYCLGWIPGRQQSGGRFVFFRDRTEYEETYRQITVAERQRNLDKLIANAGIRGGKSRSKLAHRSGR